MPFDMATPVIKSTTYNICQELLLFVTYSWHFCGGHTTSNISRELWMKYYFLKIIFI